MHAVRLLALAANVVVMLAAAGAWGTGANWPDLAVAALMAVLAGWGSLSVLRQARCELRFGRPGPEPQA